MFSGIIEEFATVVAIKKDRDNIDFTLTCSFVDELSIDQSVAHNGVCLTPGDCFEQPKSMRIGYASDVQTLKDGLAAISAFLRILEQEEQA